MEETKKNFNLNIVIEPRLQQWFDAGEYIKIMEFKPRKVIYLSKCKKDIWLLINEDEYTGNQIVSMLDKKYDYETIIESLSELYNLKIIGEVKDYLWIE